MRGEAAWRRIRRKTLAKSRSLGRPRFFSSTPLAGTSTQDHGLARDEKNICVGTWLELNFGKGFVEEADGLIHVGLGDIEHGREPDDIAVKAALTDQESIFAGALEQLRRRLGSGFLGGAIFDEFETLHQSFAAHVADRSEERRVGKECRWGLS